jgi:hypothetical protein
MEENPTTRDLLVQYINQPIFDRVIARIRARQRLNRALNAARVTNFNEFFLWSGGGVWPELSPLQCTRCFARLVQVYMQSSRCHVVWLLLDLSQSIQITARVLLLVQHIQ